MFTIGSPFGVREQAMRAGTFRMGLCGQLVSATRVSFFRSWTEDTIKSQ